MSSIRPGLYDNVKITRSEFREVGQKQTPLLELFVEIEGEQLPVNVWLSEKALRMARRALKLVGFDIDKHPLSDLARNPRLLAGQVIPQIDVEVDSYGPKGSIFLGSQVDDSALNAITAKLRGIKKDDEPDVAPRAITPPENAKGIDFDDIPF